MSKRKKSLGELDAHLIARGVGSRTDFIRLEQNDDGDLDAKNMPPHLYSVHPDFNAHPLAVDIDLVDGWIHEFRLRLNPAEDQQIHNYQLVVGMPMGNSAFTDITGGVWLHDKGSSHPDPAVDRNKITFPGTILAREGHIVFETGGSRWHLDSRTESVPGLFNDIRYRTRAKLHLQATNKWGDPYSLIKPDALNACTYDVAGLKPEEYVIRADNNVPDLRVTAEFDIIRQKLRRLCFTLARTHGELEDLERISVLRNVCLRVKQVLQNGQQLVDQHGTTWDNNDTPVGVAPLELKALPDGLLHGDVDNSSCAIHLLEATKGRVDASGNKPVWELY